MLYLLAKWLNYESTGENRKKGKREEKKEKYVYTPLTPGVISGAALVNIHHLVATT